MPTIILTFEEAENYKRLDQFLSDKTEMSRSQIKQLFESNSVTSNVNLKLNKIPKLKAGETLEIVIEKPDPIPSTAEPEDIPLDILFEDEYLLFVNKPAGMVVHPAPGNYSGTLVNALLFHCPDLKGIGGVQRPGIVHRLDKGTSGVMIVAKQQKTHEKLVNIFSEHNIKREYEALTLYKGKIERGKLESLIARHPKNRLKMTTRVHDGKTAITFYELLKRSGDLAHFKVTLETGRTHQIRVHFSELLNAPLLNDELYGNPAQQRMRLEEPIQKIIGEYEFPFLHAKTLGLTHPITGQDYEFTVPPPGPFSLVLERL